MNTFKKSMWIVSCFIAIASCALANSNTIVAYPTAPVGASGVLGDGAPGFGTSSWQAVPVAPDNKSQYYVTTDSLFGHDVTIGDLTSISWWTKKPTVVGPAVDWYAVIYTKPTGPGTGDSSWFRSSLTAEPYLAHASTFTSGAWTKWSSNDAIQPLGWSDHLRSGNIGTPTDPTLAEYTTGTPNGHDYSKEVITYFSMQTGSAWAGSFTGELDGLTVTLANGEVGTVDFAATPEPSFYGVLTLGIAALFLARRRRVLAK